MNLLEIEAFLAIIETRSLSKAAEKLFISQSTISNRLTCLEEEVGEYLIIRRPGIKGITLTPKGTEFISFAIRYLSVERDIKTWKENISRYDLKISGPHSLNSYLFTNLFASFSDNTLIKLSVSTHWNNTIYNLLDNYQLDIGLVSRSFPSRNLITKPLFHEPMVMISDIRYSNYKSKYRAVDLSADSEIFLDWGEELEAWRNRIWSPLIKPKINVDTPMLIESFLQSKNAWAIVPEYIAVCINKNQNIMISTIDPPLPNRIIYLVTQREENPSGTGAIALFLEEMQKYIRTLPYVIPYD